MTPERPRRDPGETQERPSRDPGETQERLDHRKIQVVPLKWKHHPLSCSGL